MGNQRSGRPRGTGGQAKDLTADEIKRIDLVMAGGRKAERNRALFYLGLGSGMRIAELCGLAMGQVWNGRAVLEEVILDGGSTKSGRSRTVSLSDQARRKVQVYLEAREELKAEAPLFPGLRPWEPIHPRSAIRLLARAFKAAGIVGASSHSLRRTHANTLRRMGVDLKLIKEQLGHASLATTDRYFRIDPAEKRAAVAKLRF